MALNAVFFSIDPSVFLHIKCMVFSIRMFGNSEAIDCQ